MGAGRSQLLESIRPPGFTQLTQGDQQDQSRGEGDWSWYHLVFSVTLSLLPPCAHGPLESSSGSTENLGQRGASPALPSALPHRPLPAPPPPPAASPTVQMLLPLDWCPDHLWCAGRAGAVLGQLARLFPCLLPWCQGPGRGGLSFHSCVCCSLPSKGIFLGVHSWRWQGWTATGL